MKFVTEKDGDSLVAIMSSIFTFCFMFLGTRSSKGYYFAGFLCLVIALRYWVKVKKADSEEFL
ncbi:MAG: hypothetical protein ACP5NS_01475 [Candidatus Pacearchaeota archaeon]